MNLKVNKKHCVYQEPLITQLKLVFSHRFKSNTHDKNLKQRIAYSKPILIQFLNVINVQNYLIWLSFVAKLDRRRKNRNLLLAPNMIQK